MIEAHDLPTEEHLDYTARTLIGQNESLLELLANLNTTLGRFAEFSDRQREIEPQGIINMSSYSGKSGAGTAAGALYQTTAKYRVVGIVIASGNAADRIDLLVGTTRYSFWAGTVAYYVPFPIELDRGVDINVADITTAAGPYSFFIFGYTL